MRMSEGETQGNIMDTPERKDYIMDKLVVPVED
jgi:hypothetical protein